MEERKGAIFTFEIATEEAQKREGEQVRTEAEEFLRSEQNKKIILKLVRRAGEVGVLETLVMARDLLDAELAWKILPQHHGVEANEISTMVFEEWIPKLDKSEKETFQRVLPSEESDIRTPISPEPEHFQIDLDELESTKLDQTKHNNILMLLKESNLDGVPVLIFKLSNPKNHFTGMPLNNNWHFYILLYNECIVFLAGNTTTLNSPDFGNREVTKKMIEESITNPILSRERRLPRLNSSSHSR